MDIDETIERVIELLDYDEAQAESARRNLPKLQGQYLLELQQRVVEHRKQLTGFSDRYGLAEVDKVSEAILEWSHQNKKLDTSHIDITRKWLESTDSNLDYLSRTMKSECEQMLGEVKSGRLSWELFIPIVDRVARTSLKKLGTSLEFEDKLSLADLASSCFFYINETQNRDLLFSDKVNVVFNCVQACVTLDQLGGFDRHADKFESSIDTELRRIGGPVLNWCKGALLERSVGNPNAQTLDFDKLVNCGALLQIWGAVDANSFSTGERDDVFETSVKVIELAGLLFEDERNRKNLTYYSWLANAYYRWAHTVLSSVGVSEKKRILELLNEGNVALATVINAVEEGVLAGQSILTFELKQLSFAMLAFETDPSNIDLRDLVISSTFSLAERYGAKLRTAAPWMNLFRIFTEFDIDPSEGLRALRAYIDQRPGKIPVERALTTIGYIEQYLARNEFYEKAKAFRNLISRPESIFALKGVLNWYGRIDLGQYQVLIQEASKHNSTRRGYLQLFCQLVLADRSSQTSQDVPIATKYANRDLGGLSFFSGSFGKFEIFGLEEVSKFLLNRGRMRGSKNDFIRCIAVLEAGLQNTDEPYWHSRICECLQDLEMYDLASIRLDLAQETCPNDSVIVIQRGLLGVRTAQPDQTLSVLDDFLSSIGQVLASSHTAIRGLYAYAALSSSRLQIAERTYRSLIQSKPNDTRAIHGLGIVLLRGDRPQVLEGTNLLIDCVKSIDSVEDPANEFVLRDSFLNISQRLASSDSSFEGGVTFGFDLVKDMGSNLRTWQLKALLQSMASVGGCSRFLSSLMEVVKDRDNKALNRSFVHFASSCLIESKIIGDTAVDKEGIIDFSIQTGLLGDLFGSSKGVYARSSAKILSRPLREKSLRAQLEDALSEEVPHQWQGLTSVVATDGYSADYYGRLYEAVEVFDGSVHEEVSGALDRVIAEATNIFLPQAESRKILLSDGTRRVIRKGDDFVFSELAADSGIICFPEIVENLIGGRILNMKNSHDERAEIDFVGEVLSEDLEAYSHFDIDLEKLSSNSFRAKIRSLPGLLV